MFSLIILTVFLLGNAANALPGNNERIVGGANQYIENAKHQVLVLPKGHLCGGSLISSQWIVTAAHCTAGYQSYDIDFSVGVQNIYDERITYTASQLVQHASYNALNKDNDIALLKSPVDIKTTSTVQPIPLMPFVPNDGSPVTVSGYGDTAFNGKISEELKSVNLNIVNFSSCNKVYGSRLTSNMICVSGGGDSCQGDSGGPLTYAGRLLGVVSFGHECANPDYPGIYASIPKYLDWILQYTGVKVQ